MIYKNKVQTILMKERNNYIKKIPRLLIIIGIFEIMYLIMYIQNIHLRENSHYVPKYKYIDLKQICNKEVLSEKDYEILFYQTGLSPFAINTLRLQPDSLKKIKL